MAIRVVFDGWSYVAAAEALLIVALSWCLIAGQSAATSALQTENAALRVRLAMPPAPTPTLAPTPVGRVR